MRQVWVETVVFRHLSFFKNPWQTWQQWVIIWKFSHLWTIFRVSWQSKDDYVELLLSKIIQSQLLLSLDTYQWRRKWEKSLISTTERFKVFQRKKGAQVDSQMFVPFSYKLKMLQKIYKAKLNEIMEHEIFMSFSLLPSISWIYTEVRGWIHGEIWRFLVLWKIICVNGRVSIRLYRIQSV